MVDENFIIRVADHMDKTLPRPARKYCKPILHEDNVEMPVITVTVGLWEW